MYGSQTARKGGLEVELGALRLKQANEELYTNHMKDIELASARINLEVLSARQLGNKHYADYLQTFQHYMGPNDAEMLMFVKQLLETSGPGRSTAVVKRGENAKSRSRRTNPGAEWAKDMRSNFFANMQPA